MDNHHLHLLLRIDPDVAKSWSAEEVIDRWHKLFPPRGTDRKPLPPAKRQELIASLLEDAKWIAQTRERLASLSWFMKCLKEPLSRMINKAEKCTGAFFEGRFKSIVVLDDEALLAICAYIDLNPVAAGIALTPESSRYTSVKARVDHVLREGGRTICRRLSEAVWLVRRLRGSWRRRCGWFRSRTDAVWIRSVRECWMVSRWAIT